MENFLIKNRKPFMFLFGNLFFLCLVLTFLNQLTSFAVTKYIGLDWLISLSIIFPFIWFFFFIKKNKDYYKAKTKGYFEYSFFIILFLLIFLYSRFYFANDLKNICNIDNYINYIIIFIFCLLCFIFYFNKEQITIDEVVKSERNREEKSEQIREEKNKIYFEKNKKINRYIRTFLKYIYKEGWQYLLIFFIISITFFAVRMFIAQNAAVGNDEGYTYAVNAGFWMYKDIGTTITGAEYTRTPIYNLFNSIGLLLTGTPLLSMRISNIILFLLVSPFLYIALKKLSNKKIALIAFFFINSNWYINSVILASRSYIFSIIFSFFSLYFMLTLQDEKKRILYGRAIASIVFMIFAFFEGHIIATYHLLPLFLFIIAFLFVKSGKRNKVIISAISILFLSSLAFYIFVINPSFGYFIYKIFAIKPSFKFLTNFGSIFSYFSSIGIALLFILIFFSTTTLNNFKKNTNRIIFLITVFCVYTYLLHSLFFSGRTKSFTYFSDIAIPLLFVFSFWVYFLIKKTKQIHKKIPIYLLLLLVLLSSVFNIKQINSENVYWQMNGRPIAKFLKEVPENSIVLTDQPLVVQILRPDLKIYVAFRWVNDDEVVDINLIQDVFGDEKYNRREFSDKEKNRFKEYIEKNIAPNYTIVDQGQLYSLYSGHPLIMSKEHLLSVFNKGNEKIYLLLAHTARDSRAKNRNVDLYNFVFENAVTIEMYKPTKNAYNDLLIKNKNGILQLLEMRLPGN